MLRISKITAENLEKGKYKKKLPELYELNGTVENTPWHPHEPVLNHIINVLRVLDENLLNLDFLEAPQKKKLKEKLKEKIEEKSKNNLTDLIRASVLLHDIGKKGKVKPKEDGSGYTECSSHEVASYRRIPEFKERFGLTSREVSFIGEIVLHHGEVHDLIKRSIDEPESKTVYLRLIKDITRNVYQAKDVYFETLLLCLADTDASNLKNSKPDEFGKRISTYRELIQSI